MDSESFPTASGNGNRKVSGGGNLARVLGFAAVVGVALAIVPRKIKPLPPASAPEPDVESRVIDSGLLTPVSAANRKRHTVAKRLLGLSGLLLIAAVLYWGITTDLPSKKTEEPATTAVKKQPEPRVVPVVSTAAEKKQPEPRVVPVVRTAAEKKQPEPRAVPVVRTADLEKDFVLIENATAVLGDTLDGMRDALPHRVRLSSYWIARHEVSQTRWDKVREWGLAHGYPDLPTVIARGPGHPATSVTWMDALKWCNALSEMEKLTPCYYQDNELTQVIRAGENYITSRQVNWDANGYRLPTEAEWEMAARGGLKGRRFPSGDELSPDEATYTGAGDLAYDKGGARPAPQLIDARYPPTSPVGSLRANPLGLHDMAGNVAEWCWDMYDKYYGIAELSSAGDAASGAPTLEVTDPKGADFSATWVVRGGSWRHLADDARCASRTDYRDPCRSLHIGFRVVRRP
jgi:formylglycine-generating enzyme required for sulfatase activity